MRAKIQQDTLLKKYTDLNLDTYKALCTEYYELDKPIVPEDEFAFYLHYINQTTGPILEPMCGTGRFLIPFLEMSKNIEGFDASPFMINVLREKCAAKNLTPTVCVEFLENFRTNKKYDHILIPNSSFNLILDLHAIKKALKNIHEHLNKDGVFVFEILTTQVAHNDIRRGLFIREKPDGQQIVLRTMAYPTENRISETLCSYELMNQGQLIQKEAESFKVLLHDPDEMEILLKEAGFTRIKRLKAYDMLQKPDTSDEVVIFEASSKEAV